MYGQVAAFHHPDRHVVVQSSSGVPCDAPHVCAFSTRHHLSSSKAKRAVASCLLGHCHRWSDVHCMVPCAGRVGVVLSAGGALELSCVCCASNWVVTCAIHTMIASSLTWSSKLSASFTSMLHHRKCPRCFEPCRKRPRRHKLTLRRPALVSLATSPSPQPIYAASVMHAVTATNSVALPLCACHHAHSRHAFT